MKTRDPAQALPKGYRDPAFLDLLMTLAAPSGAALSPGEALTDRYVLERLLGCKHDAPCEVWLAVDHWCARPVVIKVLVLDRLRGEEVAVRFEREIRALARLEHRGVVALWDEGVAHSAEHGPCRYFVMERLTGAPFPGRGDLRGILEGVDGLLAVMAYAHARGIVHRDLKPHNVFVLPGDAVKVFDFGIARPGPGVGLIATRPRLGDWNLLGTVAYMSPEQARGEPFAVGPGSDLYAVGVMLYEALTGARPFAEAEASAEGWTALCLAHAFQEAPPLAIRPQLSSALDADLSALTRALLAKRYEARPESAADARRSLAAILARLSPARSPQAAPRPPAPPQADSDAPDPFEVWAVEASWRLPFWRDPPPAGRAQEQRRLLAQVEPLTHGDRPQGPRVVFLTGAPGSGKTRLARWLAETLLERGDARVLRLDLRDRALPAALHDALYRHLRLPRLEEGPLLERLKEALPSATPEQIQGLARFLMHRADLGLQAQQPESEPAWRALGCALLALLTLDPSPRPLLLWLDGDGLDAATGDVSRWLDAIQRLSAPVLALWSHAGPLSGPEVFRNAEHIHLGVLPEDAQSELMAQLVPGLSARGQRAVRKRARGNPLFIREVLYGWRSAGLLEFTAEGLTPGPEALDALPARLEEVLAHQLQRALGRHTPQAQAAALRGLRTVALLGPSFEAAHVGWALERVGLTLSELRARGWIAPDAPAREPRYAFANPLFQRMLIRQAVESGELGAGLEACVELRLRAHLAALVRSDWQGALDNLHTAWSQLERLAPAAQPLLRLRLLDNLALVHYRQRNADAVERYAAQLQAQAERLGAREADGDAPSAAAAQPGAEAVALDASASRLYETAARLWAGAAALLRRDHGDAEQRLRAAVGAAQAPGDAPLRAMAWQLLGQLALTRRDLGAAREALEQASHLLERAQGDATSLARRRRLGLAAADVLRDVSELEALAGEVRASLEPLRRACAVYAQLGDVQGEAYAFMGLARLHRRMLEGASGADALAEEAARCRQRARVLMADLDDPRGAALLLWEEALAAMARADFDAAQAMFGQAHDAFRFGRDPRAEALSLNGRAEALRRLGESAQARALYGRFGAACAALHDPRGQGMARTNLGWLELGAGDLDAASAHFQAALEHLGGAALAQERVVAHIGLAAVAQRGGDPRQAAARLVLARREHQRPVQDQDALWALDALEGGAPGVDDQGVRALVAALRGLGDGG